MIITGAYGLLGQELTRYFKDIAGWAVIPLTHQDLDVTKAEIAAPLLKRIRPDVLINCAAIVPVERCQADPERAFAVNRDGALVLAEAAATLPIPPTFVQISSSVVFGGWEEGEYKINGYAEEDLRRPNNVYEQSKKEAEDLIKAVAAQSRELLGRWYIVRASVLYGEARPTIIDEFTEKIRAGGEIVAVHDRWSSPTWTKDFAAGLFELITSSSPSGTYHIANEVKPGEATAIDVVEEISSHFGIKPDASRLKLVSRKDFFKIPRAPSNVLLNTQLPKLRYWREAMREYLRQRYPTA